MTRRQSTLKRSSAVEPARDGCEAARARTTGGTTITTVARDCRDDPTEDFELSVRESLDTGAGVGADLFAAHWHTLPCELGPPEQQPQQAPVAPPQQERRGCELAVQCGHFAAAPVFARTTLSAFERGV